MLEEDSLRERVHGLLDDMERLVAVWREKAGLLLGNSAVWDGDEAFVYDKCADDLEAVLNHYV